MLTATEHLSHEARVIDAAFQAILDQDWPRLDSLQRAHPHLTLDPGRGWTDTQHERLHGCGGRSVWNLERTAFVVVAGDEQTARWLGYKAAEEDGIEVIFWGSAPCGSGCVAQFTVGEWDGA